MKNVILKRCLPLVLAFCHMVAFSQKSKEQTEVLSSKSFFIENKGQWHEDVLYLAQQPNMNIWITKFGARYDHFQLFELPFSAYNDNDRYLLERYKEKKQGIRNHVVDVRNHAANVNPNGNGNKKSSTYYNYFLGNDASKWASNVPLYEEVIVQDVYTGIDQRWYFENGKLRYDYVVKPNANPEQINMQIQGATEIRIEENDLVYQTRFGNVTHTDLFVYQLGRNNEKVPVSASWILKNGLAFIELGAYDHSKPLIIDPIIQSTYIGGNNNDLIYDLATPGQPSEKYICGATLSANYPINFGTYDETFSANFDVVVSRFATGLNSLQFSTFIGHTAEERAYGIAVNTVDGIYITGVTYSTSFPTINAYDNSYFNNGDVFVCKLNLAGNSLIYSTFMGLGGTDVANAIDINSNGEAFITGRTTGGFPVTAGVVQNSLIGVQNAFVTKINAAGNTLGFSTFFGRSNDIAYSIKVAGQNNVYISGETFSDNLPVTAGAVDATYNGGKDAFVVKYNSTATQILACTYLGGSSDEVFAKLDVDYSQNVYVAGGSLSLNFPTTVGAYVNNPGLEYFDIFVTKLNPTFTTMLYSTKFGQTFDDYAQDIVVDAGGFAHIAAFVSGAGFPTTAGADFATARGNQDIAIVKLNQAGSALVYSSYYGGANNDIVTAIDLNYAQSPRLNNANHTVSFAGYTGSFNYHTAGVPFQSVNGGGTNDGFCTSIQICAIVNPNNGGSIPFSNAICSGSSVNYTMNASGGASPYTYIWTPYFGTQINTTAGVTLSPTQTTQYVYVATDNNGCVGANLTTLQVNPAPSAAAASGTSACQNLAISPAITISTTGATGIGTPAGLPSGVTASYNNNVITLSGTPTGSGTFNYNIPLTGSCSGNATGTLVVSATSSYTGTTNQTVCVNAALTTINLPTTGVTGIGAPSNLPAGVSASFASNTITISGTPSASGTFNYTIPLVGCGSNSVTGTLTVNPINTFSGTTNRTTCINTAITPISLTTTGATGINSVTNLPAGVTASFASNTVTISGTPSVSGTFNYSLNLTGGCGAVSVSGTITVNANNTVNGTANQTVCMNAALTNITLNTTGATGIGTPTGLPAGVSASWSGNVITISGTPSSSGTFNYTIPLSGGCGNAQAAGAITVNPLNTVAAASPQTICMNSPITPITHATTGATGIGMASGLPNGVTASFSGNTITISGTPNMQGTFNYSIPLTGGCGAVTATGTITVSGFVTATPSSSTSISVCENNAIQEITFATQGAIGINSYSNLPAGVSASLTSNVLTVSGIPTETGTFNFEIILDGCGLASAQGTIIVWEEASFAGNSELTTCVGSPILIELTTSNVLGLGSPMGLPVGVNAVLSGNILSISGTSLLPGTYNYSIPLATNCDFLTLTGTIVLNGPDLAVSLNNQTLTANQANATYQWVDCDNANAPIAGATSQSYTPESSGNYAVEVTQGGCTASSTCVAVTIDEPVGIEESDENATWLIYPNPAQGMFYISGPIEGNLITVLDVSGKVIFETTAAGDMMQIQTYSWQSGVYFVQVRASEYIQQQKLVLQH
jgi:hypothetical protein